MRRQSLIACAFVVSAFAAAGCVGNAGSSGSADASGSATADAGENVGSNAQVGTLSGVVTDDEVRPVAGVNVAILQPSVSATTDAEGRYTIVNLPVGTYDVYAERLGFKSRAAKVTIEVGKTTTHDFVLTPLAVGDAFIDYYHRTLLIECMLFANPLWVSACSYPYTAVYLAAHNNGVNLSHYGLPDDVQDNKVRINFTVGFGVKGIVSEMTWVPTADSGRTMRLVHCEPADYDPVLDSCSFMSSQIAKSPISYQWQLPKDKVPKKEGQVYWVMALIWPWPAAVTDVPGVILDQKHDLYESRFYGEAPPEDWTILAKG